MGRLVCAALVVGAFACGVYVGQMPIVPHILGSGDRGDDVAPVTTAPVKSAIPTPVPTPAASANSTLIKTTQLTPGQQKLLSVLGINASEIVITPAMVACAEAKVGAARLKEIEGGATPSLTEGISLLACYNGR